MAIVVSPNKAIQAQHLSLVADATNCSSLTTKTNLETIATSSYIGGIYYRELTLWKVIISEKQTAPSEEITYKPVNLVGTRFSSGNCETIMILKRMEGWQEYHLPRALLLCKKTVMLWEYFDGSRF